MRRLTGWIGGALGGITAYRLLRRRSRVAPESAPPEAVDTRAEELREKLAESRATDPLVEDSSVEPVAEEEAPPEAESPDERRRRVHEEGRAALDEMRPE